MKTFELTADTPALTLIQPWGSLIVGGWKDVENRSWRPPASLIGQPLLIHAGLKVDPAGFARARELGIVLPDELPAGGIIGQVTVTGCVDDSDSPWASPGQWHWLLADARELAFKAVRGQMGIFHVGPRTATPQTALDVG